MKTKHIIIDAEELPKNIRYKLSKDLLTYECLTTLTIYQAEKLLDLVQQVSSDCLTHLLSKEY